MAGFVFFDSYDAALRNLPDEDRLALYDAMCAFAFRGEEPSLSPLLASFFALIKPTIEKSLERQENGKKGGRPRKENQCENHSKNLGYKQEKKQRREETEVIKEVEKETEDIPAAKPPSAPRFQPPTVDEVLSYCQERKNGVNPEQFVDFYSAKGWRIGNQPMKDWKAALRTWERREQAGGKPRNEEKYDYSKDVDFFGR